MERALRIETCGQASSVQPKGSEYWGTDLEGLQRADLVIAQHSVTLDSRTKPLAGMRLCRSL